jgi:hypothetical protein
MGFFSKYESNPLSAIHTTLKRDQSIRNFKNAGGKTVFEPSGPLLPPKALMTSVPPNAPPQLANALAVDYMKKKK